jgi:FkbM family methyltransferase
MNKLASSLIGTRPGLEALAFLMRRMPVGIRKFSWWWDRMYQAIGGGRYDDDPAIDALWPAGESGPVRSRRFGYRVRLDLRSWLERRFYFSGSYYQRDLERLYPLILRPGDQYLDIGANIGMTALMGSALIGRHGRGFAFEPNPETFARLRRHLDLNRVSNIEPVPYALADREAEASLVLPTPHSSSGVASLGLPREGGSGRAFPVRTATGRPYLERLDPARPTVVKIDVEGYEFKALGGMRDLLDWPEVAIVAEVNDSMLRRAGDSADSLFELLSSHGFRPLRYELRAGRFRTDFRIEAVLSFRDALAPDGSDFLFARPGSRLYRERIAPALSARRSDPPGRSPDPPVRSGGVANREQPLSSAPGNGK